MAESTLMNKEQFAAHCDRSVKWLEKAQADGHVTPIMREGRCYYRPEWRDDVRARTKGKSSGDVAPQMSRRRVATGRRKAAERASAEYFASDDAQRKDRERLESERQTLIADEAARLAKFDAENISEPALLERLCFDAAAEYLRRRGRPSQVRRSLNSFDKAVGRGLDLIDQMMRENRLTPLARVKRQWLVPSSPDLRYEQTDPTFYFAKVEAKEAEAWADKVLQDERSLVKAAAETVQGKPKKIQEFLGNLLVLNAVPPEQRAELARRLVLNLLRPE